MLIGRVVRLRVGLRRGLDVIGWVRRRWAWWVRWLRMYGMGVSVAFGVEVLF